MAKVTFPKYGEKHELTPLFEPSKVFGRVRTKANIPKKVILIYSRKLAYVWERELKLRRDRYLTGRLVNAIAVYRSKMLKNTIVVLIGIGAPITAVVTEELISFGAEEFLIMGAAGALNKKLDFADFVICTKAVRDEGTSHHYLKNSIFVEPDAQLTKKLEAAATHNKGGLFKGPTWTIDAPYRETAHEVAHYRNKGVLTVEMEAAALFAVAKKKKAKAAALFVISDLLDPEGWSGFAHGGRIKRKRFGYPVMAKIAISIDRL